MSIKVNFGLQRLDKIIAELDEQINYLEKQKQTLKYKRTELALCEKLIN